MPRINLIGCPIDALDTEQTIAKIEQWVAERIPRQHVVVNVAKFVAMRQNPKLKKIISSCDIINADGMPIVWASKLLGTPLPSRVAGIDLFTRLVMVCADKGYRPFFFGANEWVVRKVVDSFQDQYPNLQVAGYRNGYFDKNQEKFIAEMIRDSKADMLFVGFSSPMKEEFLNNWITFMGVPFSMGVGGSFDVIAGKTQRAPIWMQTCGLEWFYRILQEPRRMLRRYAKTNPIFIKLILQEYLKQKIFSKINI